MNEELQRQQILGAIRIIMADGIARSSREIARSLTSKGIEVKKDEVNRILHHPDGKQYFFYDREVYTYVLISSDTDSIDFSRHDLVPIISTPHNLEAVLEKIYEMELALAYEIASVKSSNGSKTYITAGIYVGSRDTLFGYQFTTDTELRLPDNSKLQIEFHGRRIDGEVLSTDGFSVVLGISQFIGDDIPFAILFTSPWFLLDTLVRRLQELREVPSHLGFAEMLLNNDSLSAGAEDDSLYSREEIWEEFIEPLESNHSQKQAVEKVLWNNITFIWGPPGTGKSSTLGQAATVLIEQGKSILVVAHSNVAVDIAMMNIGKNFYQTSTLVEGKLIRLGVTQHTDMQKPHFEQMQIRGVLRRVYPELIQEIETTELHLRETLQSNSNTEATRTRNLHKIEALQKTLQKLREEMEAYELQLIEEAQVIGCTLSKLAITEALQQLSFDCVFIDEASMAYVPACIYASTFAERRVVVYGDFRQLAPIAQAEHELTERWLKRDIFDHAGIIKVVDTDRPDARLTMLDTQYRMHPSIADIPNRLFYNNRIKTSAEIIPHVNKIASSQPNAGHVLDFVDVSPLHANCIQERESYSRFNIVSAIQAARYMIEAIEEGLSVGIVTPFSAQSRLINRIIRDLNVPREMANAATVHRFQGSERDVIIFDVVESKSAKPSRLMTEQGDIANRLSNVAITRAIGKFILLGDSKFIEQDLSPKHGFRKLTEQVISKGFSTVLSWKEHTKHLINRSDCSITQYATSKDAFAQLEADFSHTDKEIAISWTSDSHKTHFPSNWLQSLQGERKRFYFTGSGSNQFHIGLRNAQVRQNRSVSTYGLIGIDQKIIWIFLEPSKENTPILRLSMPQTVQLLYAFFSLIPQDQLSSETIEQRVAQGKSPLGGFPCVICGQLVWPQLTRDNRPILRCTNPTCGHIRNMDAKTATELARLMDISCSNCGAQMKGRRGSAGVFLGCTNYPTCQWTRPIEDLI